MQSVGKRARVVLGAALTVGLLASTAVASWATTTYQSYNVTIPKLGGDGYTSTQKKTETDRQPRFGQRRSGAATRPTDASCRHRPGSVWRNPAFRRQHSW